MLSCAKLEHSSLTILIPTHGRPTLLGQTLESISDCRVPKDYEELIVIENGSRAGAEQIVERLPERLKARYMHRTRGNKSYALNEALDTVPDGLVVFFDDDVKVHPDTLVAYADAAREYGRGHFFGGPVRVDRKKDMPDWIEEFFPSSTKGYDLINGRLENAYLGFNWAAFVSDLNQAGGFDPRLGPGVESGASVGDETELQKKLRANGCVTVDVMRAKVQHHVPAESVTLRWLLDRCFRGGIRSGLCSDSPWFRFWPWVIWRTLVSTAAAGKAAVFVDKKKLGRELTSTFRRAGIVKGHLWKQWNNGERSPTP